MKDPRPFPRGDNYEIAKIHLQNLKIFFTGPVSTKLDTKHPWVKREQVFTNKEHSILKKECCFSLTQLCADVYID